MLIVSSSGVGPVKTWDYALMVEMTQTRFFINYIIQILKKKLILREAYDLVMRIATLHLGLRVVSTGESA